MVRERADVPDPVLERLRAICMALPDAHEEAAWVGTRWRIRTHTFAHVVPIADGRPPAYVRAAGSDGPLIVLTFRSEGEELLALASTGRPFFKPEWWGDILGVEIDDRTDWTEIGELLTESYCLLAPKKLVAQVVR